MRYVTLCLLVVAVASFAFAQGDPSQKGAPPSRPVWKWEKVVDQKVVVEGLAWGYMNKGLSCWVVTGDGGRLYASGVDFKDLNGRLVRFTGVLRKKHMPAAPPYAQGYGQAFDYFEIEVAEHEVLESTEAAWVSALPAAK